MAHFDADRYAGKPMLKLLDSYVLDAIGALDSSTAATLAAQAATFGRVFSVQADTWQGVVEAAMEMPPDSGTGLREAWENNVHVMVGRGETPNPLAFAQTMVDARFGNE